MQHLAYDSHLGRSRGLASFVKGEVYLRVTDCCRELVKVTYSGRLQASDIGLGLLAKGRARLCTREIGPCDIQCGEQENVIRIQESKSRGEAIQGSAMAAMDDACRREYDVF